GPHRLSGRRAVEPGVRYYVRASFLLVRTRRRAFAEASARRVKYARRAASGSGYWSKRAMNAARPLAVRAARSAVFAHDSRAPTRPTTRRSSRVMTTTAGSFASARRVGELTRRGQ